MSTSLQHESDLQSDGLGSKELELRARMLQTTLSSIADFAYIFDKSGRFIYSNQALLDLLGVSAEEIAGKNFFDLGYPDELAGRLQQQIQEVVDKKTVVVDETPFTSPTGVAGYYEYIFTPVFGSDGAVEVVAGSTRNITERKRIENALQASEEYSRHILESITDAFFALGQDWRFTYVNRQACFLLDRGIEDLVGKVIWEVFPALIGSDFAFVYRRAASARTASSFTSFFADHNRWYEVHVYPAPSGITVYFRDVSERVRAEDDLRHAKDELEVRIRDRTRDLERANVSLVSEMAERKLAEAARVELLQRLANAQEQERRRISREMHDSLGQHLTALTIGLKRVQADADCPPPLFMQLEQLRATAFKLDEEIDRLSYELRPRALDDLGLGPALRRHAQAWSQESGIAVEVHMRGIENERLPATIETTAYRITQEAFTNILKHANATQVSILAEKREDELRVIVEDNGSGFDPESTLATTDARSIGLKGMAERAALVAGQLEIESAPGKGATIYLTIPLNPGGAAPLVE